MPDFSSIFTGSNPTLSSGINNLQSLAGYSSNTGENATNAATGYDQGILSGDPTQVAQTLAPEIQTAQQQAQQNKNTVAQFGNRGGGMNAVSAGLDDATRGKIISLIGQLRQGAAGQLGQLGTQNLQLGQQGNVQASQLSQEQLQDYMNSILGKGAGQGVGGYITSILGGLG